MNVRWCKVIRCMRWRAELINTSKDVVWSGSNLVYPLASIDGRQSVNQYGHAHGDKVKPTYLFLACSV